MQGIKTRALATITHPSAEGISTWPSHMRATKLLQKPFLLPITILHCISGHCALPHLPHLSKGVRSHLSQSWVRGCASRARRASPSSVPAADASLPWPAEAALVRGLNGASLRRSAKMRSASAARALPGRALLSLNSLHVQDVLHTTPVSLLALSMVCRATIPWSVARHSPILGFAGLPLTYYAAKDTGLNCRTHPQAELAPRL